MAKQSIGEQITELEALRTALATALQDRWDNGGLFKYKIGGQDVELEGAAAVSSELRRVKSELGNLYRVQSNGSSVTLPRFQ